MRSPAIFRGLAATGAVAVALIFAPPAIASEGGGNQYFLGAANIGAGQAPPPGDYLYVYTGMLSSPQFNDGNGNKYPIPFHADSEYVAIRYAHRSSYEILGGRWGFYVVLPYTSTGARALGRDMRKSGLGDISLSPISVAWQAGPLHWAAGVDVTLPTGEYDKNDLVKVGRNYVGVAPNFAVTYLPGNGMELSTRLLVSFNGTNPDTDYRSGREFIADYFLGYRFAASGTAAGILGYSYVQISDDKVNGIRNPDTRGRANAIGLALNQSVGPARDGIKLAGSFTHEYSARNRPLANRGVLRLTIDF